MESNLESFTRNKIFYILLILESFITFQNSSDSNPSPRILQGALWLSHKLHFYCEGPKRKSRGVCCLSYQLCEESLFMSRTD